MDRKSFLRNSAIGASTLLIPTLNSFTSKANARSTAASEPKIIRQDDGDVLNVIGDIQTHKLVGAETGNQIAEWTNNVDPGVGIPPHYHTREDEIFRVIKGEFEIMVDGDVSVLKAGDIAFAPRNVPHAWKVVGDEKGQMITSAFPAGIEDMFEELSQLPAGPPDFGKVTEICGRFGVEFV